MERIIALFDRPLSRGTVIRERYRIEEIIGMGSYGCTYLVMDLASSQQKVVKQLRKSKRRLAEGRKSFSYEQHILAKLQHTAIPQLFESFIWKNELFFVMSYIEGKTFEELIFEENKVYEEQEVLEILDEILSVLSYVHEQGIVHRDLRIPNIIVKDGSISLIDFGLARYLGERDEREETFIEEKKYMREIHYRSDFYALGHFVLFLLYAGYTPVCKEERPWYEELSLSPHLHLLLRRMLQMEEPYEHIQELIQDVQVTKEGLRKNNLHKY
ncbi:serine/threonine protein kinase [Microbacteriaceae bacterium 4G12]